MSLALSEVPGHVIAQSLTLRRDRDPLRFFEPASPEQQEALRLNGKGALILGGNRSGKSQIGAVRTVLKATGRELPQFPGLQFKRARLIWCVSQDLPGQAARNGEPEEPHTQLEAIRSWMPPTALRGGSWASAYSPSAYVLTLANGTKLQFKSYDQGLLQFESAKVGHIWFDEEPTQPAIFTSCLLRLVDERGTWDMTLTPVLSLQGKTGIAEQLWDGKEEGARGESPYGAYDTVQLFTSRNVHLPTEEVKALERLPEDEKQVRLYGAFARLGGRVLNEFDPRKHLVNDFLPPASWRHRLLIDPGWHVGAHLFSAEDPEGNVFLYAEHYQGHWRPKQHVQILHGIYIAFGSPPIQTLMDPSGEYQGRSRTGQETPSDADEYRQAARDVGADWLKIGFADNGDPMAWTVKRYLAADRLFVCRSLKMWLWEQERWTRQRERTGALATEKPVPEMPIDRNNHLMDLTRYLCNEMGEPKPRPEAAIIPGSLADYWRREREGLDGTRTPSAESRP